MQGSGFSITREYAQEQLELWYKALTRLSNGVKSYRLGSRELTNLDLPEVLRMVDFWEGKVKALTRGRRSRTVRVVPRDL